MKPGFGNIQSTFSSSRYWTPQTFTVTQISGGIRISFTPVAGTETEIWCAVNGGILYIVTTCGIGVTSYDWMVPSGADFSFELRSKTDTTVLNAPTNVTATRVLNYIHITWVDNNTEAEFFDIYAKIGVGSYALLTSITPSVQVYDYYRQGGVTLTYKIVAREGTIPILSVDSNETSPLVFGIYDGDGNEYTEVTIGTQVWLKENLKTTKYNDGSAIANVTDNAAWAALTSGAYCWFNNDINFKTNYGGLYNGYLNLSKLLPIGYGCPSGAQWDTMVAYLGGASVAGAHLKESGTTYWSSPNTGADNSSGFYGRGGGFRTPTNGTFLYFAKEYGLYAQSDWKYNLIGSTINSVVRDAVYLKDGLSVRGIKI